MSEEGALIETNTTENRISSCAETTSRCLIAILAQIFIALDATVIARNSDEIVVYSYFISRLVIDVIELIMAFRPSFKFVCLVLCLEFSLIVWTLIIWSRIFCFPTGIKIIDITFLVHVIISIGLLASASVVCLFIAFCKHV